MAYAAAIAVAGRLRRGRQRAAGVRRAGGAAPSGSTPSGSVRARLADEPLRQHAPGRRSAGLRVRQPGHADGPLGGRARGRLHHNPDERLSVRGRLRGAYPGRWRTGRRRRRRRLPGARRRTRWRYAIWASAPDRPTGTRRGRRSACAPLVGGHGATSATGAPTGTTARPERRRRRDQPKLDLDPATVRQARALARKAGRTDRPAGPAAHHGLRRARGAAAGRAVRRRPRRHAVGQPAGRRRARRRRARARRGAARVGRAARETRPRPGRARQAGGAGPVRSGCRRDATPTGPRAARAAQVAGGHPPDRRAPARARPAGQRGSATRSRSRGST